MTSPAQPRQDRELLLVVQALERLTVRVEAQFNPELVESGDQTPSGDQLLAYARTCREVLDDPALSARLKASRPRW
ncbi:hypothetical protein IU450_28745 [Nocardia abscessus]|uniref:hypothetical protein n=1 Tax=Nocardia abscessus TaxID=120957 RepID=UPI0018939D22|nr:hypothetical protein [Nocardia abscessus]MBF6339850.1 hypothetical protein [Nocardia abscessus]